MSLLSFQPSSSSISIVTRSLAMSSQQQEASKKIILKGLPSESLVDFIEVSFLYSDGTLSFQGRRVPEAGNMDDKIVSVYHYSAGLKKLCIFTRDKDYTYKESIIIKEGDEDKFETEVIYVLSEHEMIKKWLEFATSSKASFLGGWYIQEYDVPFIEEKFYSLPEIKPEDAKLMESYLKSINVISYMKYIQTAISRRGSIYLNGDLEFALKQFCGINVSFLSGNCVDIIAGNIKLHDALKTIKTPHEYSSFRGDMRTPDMKPSFARFVDC